ncbi:MAG TPA: long-chain fatty acid--CoA ligase [Blastocatellia bacterium]|nr:long-chain fatty acid--CoA ligase [Blastocatellia bacterium]HMV82572.1 long-chain fatty acid--CoA ligase [Blastocatellia bacterium]HMX29392.1 long-chain fatty acid--CoA ligase [Blastocatellia bacterium]HMZ19035.1 long-chain fatty acid--CoA ligase [Blastocatellia bacterium]HNG32028.1 long-chain fatty acid--CoA ligase [Blastocatellia bacterium]
MPDSKPPIKTLIDLFEHVAANPKADLLNYKSNGQWKAMATGELIEKVRLTTMGLFALGVEPGNHVGLLSENRVEWTIADLAAIHCGAADVPIYPTQSPKQVAYILKDAGVEVLFLSNQAQYDRVRDALNTCPKLRVIISFDPVNAPSGKVMNFEELINWGIAANDTDPQAFDRMRATVTPETLATLIYTSGTTGDPKGVMLTHRNLIANALSTSQVTVVHEDDPGLSFLPFSHIFERAVIYFYFYNRARIFYAQSIETVARDLLEVRPYYMTSVPRLFEKIYAKAMDKAEEKGAAATKLARWSVEVAKQWAEVVSKGGQPSFGLSLKHKIADALVLSKWRAAMGGRIKYFVCGGAALAPDLAKVFYAAGMPILQGYGLTESSPGISANSAKENRLGSVGRPMPGVTVKIAEDGEILCAGANVMRGYYNKPEETDAALETDADGRVWLHTGDVGYLDADGYLFITDRKKDLLKTSGGKYIAPQPIENAIKQSRFVNQVLVIGEGRKFPAALIVPQMDVLLTYAAQQGITAKDATELIRHPQIISLMESEVDRNCGDLSKYERIKAVLLLDRELTIESGELTPTLKIKRRVVVDKNKKAIDRLYEEKQAAHAETH